MHAKLAAALLQAGQVQEVVDHGQQPLGVVAGIDQEFELLRQQRPHVLLQEQVQHQADARQRRLQLVADRGHHVALHFVQEAEPRHVFQQHRGPQRGRRGIANRQDPRKIGIGLFSLLQNDDFVEAFGHVRALFLQGLGQGLPQGFRRFPDRRRRAGMLRMRQAEEAAGGRIGHLHAALRIDHQDRLGKGVDRRLARPLGADQLGLVRLTIFAELAGHRIEGRSKLPQLVVGSDRHDLVEIAGPDGHGRFRRRADRIDDHANRVGHEKHGQHDAARQPQPYQISEERARRFVSSSTSFMFFSFSRRISPETVLIS